MLRNCSGRKDDVPNHLRALHGGKSYDSQWGKRFGGGGVLADQIAQMFTVSRRHAGLGADGLELSTAAFRRSDGAQLSLFS